MTSEVYPAEARPEAPFNEGQSAVLDAAARDAPDPLLVLGAPGTGKTMLTVELAMRHLYEGHDSSRLLVLSPTRLSAARIRDSLEHRLTEATSAGHHISVTEQPSKSFASYAFWILGRARQLGIQGADSRPRLLSGAEQDRILAGLISDHQQEAADDESPWSELRHAFDAERGLRREVRDFLDRCREYRITSDILRHQAEQPHGRAVWGALADIAEEYERTLSRDYPGAYDPAALMTRACELLESPLPDPRPGGPEYFWQLERERVNRILVDDLQDASPSVYRLLRLIGVDNHTIAFASPDTSAQGFRGARPDLLTRWSRQVRSESQLGALGSMASSDPRSVSVPRTVTLTQGYRLTGEVAGLYAATVQRVGVVSSILRSMRQATGSGAAQEDAAPQVTLEADSPQGVGGVHGNATVCSYPVANSYLAEQLMVQQVLHAHHHDHVRWEDIAIMARSGSALQRITRILTAHGVNVARSASDTVLHEEPAVSPLLTALGTAPAHRERHRLSYPQVIALLSSAYASVDAVELRRIQHHLQRRYRELGESAPPLPQPDALASLSVAELLILHCVTDPGIARQLGCESASHRVFAPVERIQRMLTAARTALHDHHLAGAPEQALWKVWEAAGISDLWQQQALAGGASARQADRHLDAVMVLFQTAERFVGHHEGASAEDFIDYVQSLDLPMDTIADTGDSGGSVEVLTPSTAVGRAFDTVIITGIQEGEWPNLQPRGELLGAGDLVTIHESGAEALTTDPRSKRAHVLQDECRLFAAAVSRARRHAVLIAVESDETTPSSLFDLHCPRRVTRSSGESQDRQVLTRVTRPLTESALTAELRGALESGTVPTSSAALTDADRHTAAGLLAEMAHHGVTEAAPEHWRGWRPLTSADLLTRSPDPILDATEEVAISPSSVDRAIATPLAWFTTAAGGSTPAQLAQELGTFIHGIAEDATDQTLDALYEALEDRWPEFAPGKSWVNEHTKRRARGMLRKLAVYFAESAAQDRVLIGTELPLNFSYTPPGGTHPVRVSGNADRVEWSPGGPQQPPGFFIVDFKTTKNPPKDAEVAEGHPQLDIYQWVAAQGAVSALLDRVLDPHASTLSARDTELRDRLLTHFRDSGYRWDHTQFALVHSSTGELIALPAPGGVPDVAAALVQLGATSQSLKVQSVAGEALPRAEAQIAQAVTVMSGAQFAARHEPGTTTCRIGELCPLCPSGKQVSEL